DTNLQIRNIFERSQSSVKAIFNNFEHWEDFLIFSKEVKSDDLFIIISSRRDQPSFNNHLNKIPYYLSNYFKNNSFLIIYPKQLQSGINMGDVQQADSTLIDTLGKISSIGKAGIYLKRIFKKK